MEETARGEIEASEGDEAIDSSNKSSRRKFLGVAGAGAGAAAVVVGTPSVAGALQGGGHRNRQGGRRNGGDRNGGGRHGNEAAGSQLQTPPTDGPDRFTRIFGRNEIGGREANELREALIEVSRPGGVLDANDPLDVGPIRLITEPELSPNNPDNPNLTAGNTFVGQFLDHDITSDAGSRLGRAAPIRRSVNLRTARFDLDSVYGGGPNESPDLGGGLGGRTPLWLYILRESELVTDGLTLGPVGARIVAEVFIGLLEMDSSSWFSADPDWRPTLPTRDGDGDFGMADLLTVAGVDPESRAA